MTLAHSLQRAPYRRLDHTPGTDIRAAPATRQPRLYVGVGKASAKPIFRLTALFVGSLWLRLVHVLTGTPIFSPRTTVEPIIAQGYVPVLEQTV